MSGRNDFYVGYVPQAPSVLGRWLRRIVLALFLLAGVMAVVLVTRQARFDSGVFEWTTDREFTGVVFELPYPTLFVMREGGDGTAAGRGVLLVAPGKFGAEELVAGMHGQAARLRGKLIHRDGRAMIEIQEAEPLTSAEAAGLQIPAAAGLDRGEVTLRGEVVDSKCFLGVMKPGHTKPHRGCAVRCISGGIAPMLLVVAPDGSARHLLLASATGEMINDEVLPYVAEPVEITGRVRAYGDLEVLYADPATYVRVAGR